MARFEQFEIWVLKGGHWQFSASFQDFDVASAVARNRSSRVRLIHAVYEDNKCVEQEVIAEVGTIRAHPE